MTVAVFGYLFLISIDFYDFISPYLPQLQFRWRRYIKHSRPCQNTFPNTSKFVKNTPLRVVFSTLFSVFGNVVKHGLSCLIYYVTHQGDKVPPSLPFGLKIWILENTVESPVATTSCNRPPLLSVQFSKYQTFPSQITIFGTSCKRPPLVSDRDRVLLELKFEIFLFLPPGRKRPPDR